MTWSVLSLGGGVMVPDKIDTAFLSGFKDLIFSLVKEGRRFIIMCGGGQTSRSYRDAAKKVAGPTEEDLDWVGISATKLNAELLRAVLSGHAHPRVIEPDKPPRPDKPIMVSSGYLPGRSTDYGTVLLAKHFRSDTVYNLTNVDYVYTGDPKKTKDIEPIPRTTWGELKKFTPPDWSPGMYTPFDPVAAKLARELKMKVIVINGKNIPNLRACLTGQDFKGTVIGG